MSSRVTEADARLPATSAAFQRAVAHLPVGGASFSVTLNGTELATFVGGEARPGVPWEPGTRSITMSMAKGLAGLVVAMLADRDQIDIDERVATYWPEFAANGKQAVTVKDVLLHTAGSIGFTRVDDVLDWRGRGWDDLDAIAAALAAAAPAWEPGTQTGYHAVTYGWLVGELVRRVDGRTLGRFFREEVAEPLGVRTAIGVPAADQTDVAICHADGMDTAPLPLRRLHRKARQRMRNPATLIGQASLGNGHVSIFDMPEDFANQPFFLAAEVPSSNGLTSARDLARVFALVAGGGELDGIRFLSQSTLARFAARTQGGQDTVITSALGPISRRLLTRTFSAERSLAFMVNPSKPGGRRPLGPGLNTVGAGGYGGQLVIADPDHGLSAAFMRSALLWPQKDIALLLDGLYKDLGLVPAER